jgi:hypothetical protein
MPRPRGYGEGKTRLTNLLDQFATAAPKESVSGLLPGLSADEIALWNGSFPYLFPKELYELYGWRNGSTGDQPAFLRSDLWFMSVPQAVELYGTLADTQGWKKGWFPVADFNGDETLVLVCKKNQAGPAQVRLEDHESGGEKRAWLTFWKPNCVRLNERRSAQNS